MTESQRVAIVTGAAGGIGRAMVAGGDEPATRSGGRRLKSAKARNRGEVGHRRCRGLDGDLAAALGWVRLDQSARADRFALAGWVWVTR